MVVRVFRAPRQGSPNHRRGYRCVAGVIGACVATFAALPEIACVPSRRVCSAHLPDAHDAVVLVRRVDALDGREPRIEAEHGRLRQPLVVIGPNARRKPNVPSAHTPRCMSTARTASFIMAPTALSRCESGGGSTAAAATHTPPLSSSSSRRGGGTSYERFLERTVLVFDRFVSKPCETPPQPPETPSPAPPRHAFRTHHRTRPRRAARRRRPSSARRGRVARPCRR